MSRNLIIGSSGQIGRHLCDYLEGKNEIVEKFDIQDSLEFDLRIQNNKKLHESLERCDFVYFLAFDVGGSRYLSDHQDKASFIGNNMKIMSNTFDAIEYHKKKFIFASSQMSYMKDSSYGLLKYLGEKMTIDLGGVVTKFWNVYGIENDPIKSHVITDLIRCGLKTNKISVMTDGKEIRQFLYADDCSECLHKVSKNYDFFSKKNLDISSFEWTSIDEIANIIAEKLLIKEIIFENKKDNLQILDPIEPNRSALSFWKPITSLSDGISMIIEFEKRKLSIIEKELK